MEIEERLRKAIDKIKKQEKTIDEQRMEIERLNKTIIANVNTITQMYEEGKASEEKIKALIVENEDLITSLNRANEVIKEMEHDAKLGHGFKELVKSINMDNNDKPRV